jgi:hypothetical protein
MFSTLNKLDKSYLLEWTFVNVAEGFDELITQAPNNISESLADKYKIFYKDKLFPLYKKRKNAFSFHYGENMSYSDTSDVDITSKAFGANDNFIDDSSSELDKIYSF